MKTYPCTFCGEPFKTRSSRKTHNAKCDKNVDREKNQAAARDGSLKALKLNKKVGSPEPKSSQKCSTICQMELSLPWQKSSG